MHKSYFKLPYPLQKILVNLYGLSIRKNRFSKVFYRELEKYLRLERNEKCGLNFLSIMDVTRDSKYYHIRTEEDFFALPIINKDIAKKNYEKIVVPERVFTYYHTSGTTGSGFTYPVCRKFVDSQWAIYWKFRYLYGLTTSTWCAYLIGRNILNPDKKKPPYWVKSYPTSQLLFSVSHLNEGTVEMYLDEIKRNGLYWMHGYPSTLNLLAWLIKKKGLEEKARKLNLSNITTSSETLYDFQKRNIEEIFGCPVRQLYGLTEGVASIFECEEGVLHVDESFSHVEFVPDDNKPGIYRIVGSTYNNKAFPLLRYDTGDTVRLYDKPFQCGCGRKSRVVKEIIGRQQDYLHLDDGTRVGGSGFFFKKAVNVRRAQIIQKKRGEATFYIVKTDNYTPQEEESIIEEIRNKLGNDFRYEIKYVDELKAERNGKMKFVINEIEEKERHAKEGFNNTYDKLDNPDKSMFQSEQFS